MDKTIKPSREFQIFAKPIGPVCNLDCHYCYYVEKEDLYQREGSSRMNDDILETYIIQHIEATTEVTQQPPALQINGEYHRDNEGNEGDAPMGAGHIEGGGGQGDTDDDGDTAGNNGRQYFIERFLANTHDAQTDEDFEHGRTNNPYLHQLHPIGAVHRRRVIKAFGYKLAHHRNYNCDIAETGTVIHGNAPFGDQQPDCPFRVERVRHGFFSKCRRRLYP